MKFLVFVLTFALLNFEALAQQEESASPETTQANWFSPACPDCAKLLTPGTANLGNSKGVYRPGDKAKLKKKLKNGKDVTK